ncbi:ABC-type transport system involved in multi-copper enzyme maturation permease subunit [Kitasatospora sp. SolWspMP-SS2h]|uniref:ABC transporter permease subunit n=1 Tax=Kitasatospora sp. SolWspMP-SS2h TaxID=1305729 RepID=UPI000DBAD6C4|nr:ABC transporter permease subunit [Kitasatospora sp. SolWspMP-SS2h]RAJ29693.1 ABC-type transport system involved in multi-copper enzyme maturation permease subunit [Kitasatospora sp. SolWspMP-SS2h]
MRRTLHSEWTKFRTVRGWVLGAVGAALVAVLFLLAGTVSSNQHQGEAAALPIGPGGEAVNDNFSFLHRALTGDGSLTVRVTALTGVLADANGGGSPGSGRDGGPGGTSTGVTPWAKAGLIIRASLVRGSSYTAVMATGAHGVRMQNDYVHDRAGDLTAHPTTAKPQWLRLVRTGTTVTGYDSADGDHWTAIGTATVPAGTVRAGLFVTAPAAVQAAGGGGGSPATATGTFGRPALTGAWSGGEAGGWTYTQVGDDAGSSGSYAPGTSGGSRMSGDGFALTGAGDIAPVVGGPAGGPAWTVETFLLGSFAGLIVVGVVAAQFAAGEYRRGLLGLTLAATPRRGRVLAAKAVVVAAVGFAVGAGAAAVSLPLGDARAHAAKFTVLTVPLATQVRAVLGTGLLLAATAVLALSLGVLLRRGATGITALVALTVLPYLLALGGVLPTAPAQWLLRLTPAAGFAVQQTLPHYEQVLSVYTPANGYFPLPPWGGFAVLLAWALVALTAAAVVLRRRDA